MSKLFILLPKTLRRLGLLAMALLITTLLFWDASPTTAQPSANCSASFFVDKTLTNGARWQLCWEHRYLDGIVYRDIYFTPPGGTSRRILSEGSISQVHVPYDDNSARFHDITDDGFGDKNLLNLIPNECPDGTLLTFGTKNVICQQQLSRGYAFKGVGTQKQGEMLSLFSVSASGDYNYIPVWRFYDDGTIDLQMGAAGKLQRFTTDSRFGWPVRSNGTRGTSHIHNYYWRLDFDLSETSSDDIVEELNYVANGDNSTRTLGVSRLSTEAARSIAPTSLRSWRIRDGAISNASGEPISYQLEPIDVGNRDVGPSFEPWTTNDFYVTKAKECERYVSHNPQLNGCANNLAGFANGESLEGADVVLWYGATFHHIPRDEDEPYMHTHWNGFRLTPQNWMDSNPSAKNVATCAVGDVTCDGKTDAADALFMLQHDVKMRTISNQLPLPQNTLYGYSCDISGEGACNATDVLFSLQCSVGMSNLFCSKEAGTVQSAQHNEAPEPVVIGIEETATKDGSERPISIMASSNSSIGALSFALRYPKEWGNGVECAADPDHNFEMSACHVDAESGMVRFTLVTTRATAGKWRVGEVKLQSATGNEMQSFTPILEAALAASPDGGSLPTLLRPSGPSETLYLPLIQSGGN